MTQEEFQIVISANADKLRKEMDKATKLIQSEADKLKKQFDRIAPSVDSISRSARNAATGVDATASASKRLRDILAKVNNSSTNIAKSTKKARSEIDKSNSSAKNLDKTFASVSKKVLSVVGTLTLVKGLIESIKMGMDALEDDNLFLTSFGENFKDVEFKGKIKMDYEVNGSDEFAGTDNANTAFGMTQSGANKFAGTINFMTANMTGNIAKSKEMSATLLQLTADMSSFYNLSHEEAFEKIRAGLTGESEPLKALGIIINETTTKQYAYANGIAKQGEALTEVQKTYARYGQILEKTSIAHGDFAKTIDSPANQLRVLITMLNEVRINLGKAFEPILRIVLPACIVLVNAINTVVKSFGLLMQALFGVKTEISEMPSITGGGSSGISNLGNEAENAGNKADEAAKKFKGLMGFDEINTLSKESKSSSNLEGSSPEIPDFGLTGQREPLEIPEDFQALADKLKDVAGQIKNIAKTIYAPIKQAWDEISPQLITQIQLAWDNIGIVFETAKGTLAGIWNNGGEEIFGDLWSIIFNIGVICGRVFNETLIPIIVGFLDLLNPDKTPGAKGFLWVMQEISGCIAGFVEYLASDGFYWVDMFVKAFIAYKVIAFAVAIVTSTVAIIANTAARVANAIARAIDIAETIYLTVLYAAETVAKWASVAATTAMTAATWLLNAAIAVLTSPITLVVLAIVALIAIVVVCYNKFEWFRNIVNAIWEAIKVAITTAIDIIKAVFGSWVTSISNTWNAIKKIFDGIINFVTGVFTGNWKQAWQGIVDIFEGIFSGLKAVALAPLNAIISAVNVVIKGLNKIELPDWVPVIGGMGINIPEIPKLATGGVVKNSTLANIGEDGAEAVVPLQNNTEWTGVVANLITSHMNVGQQTNNTGNDKPIEVTLQIGATKMGKVVVDSYNKLARQEGRVLFNL